MAEAAAHPAATTVFPAVAVVLTAADRPTITNSNVQSRRCVKADEG
jgi:hypothetical protein